jgi:hypothetical protein
MMMMMVTTTTGLIETFSGSENNKYRVCQTKYIVLFMLIIFDENTTYGVPNHAFSCILRYFHHLRSRRLPKYAIVKTNTVNSCSSFPVAKKPTAHRQLYSGNCWLINVFTLPLKLWHSNSYRQLQFIPTDGGRVSRLPFTVYHGHSLKSYRKLYRVIRKKKKKRRDKSDVFLWVNCDKYKFQRFAPTIINDAPHNIT